MRSEHLKRLNRIYEERRQVNLEAISVLVSARHPLRRSPPWRLPHRGGSLHLHGGGSHTGSSCPCAVSPAC